MCRISHSYVAWGPQPLPLLTALRTLSGRHSMRESMPHGMPLCLKLTIVSVCLTIVSPARCCRAWLPFRAVILTSFRVSLMLFGFGALENVPRTRAHALCGGRSLSRVDARVRRSRPAARSVLTPLVSEHVHRPQRRRRRLRGAAASPRHVDRRAPTSRPSINPPASGSQKARLRRRAHRDHDHSRTSHHAG